MVTLAFHRIVQLQQQGRKCYYLSHVVTTTSDIKTADFSRRLDQLPMQHLSKLYVLLPYVFCFNSLEWHVSFISVLRTHAKETNRNAPITAVENQSMTVAHNVS